MNKDRKTQRLKPVVKVKARTSALARDPRIVGVIGATPMGRSVARFFAECHYNVWWIDEDEAELVRELEYIRESLGRRAMEGYLPREELDATLGRIFCSTERANLLAAPYVVDAVEDTLSQKHFLMEELESLLNPDVLIISTSFAVGIDRIAAAMRAPERLVGLHLIGLGGTFQLAEVIPGEKTAPETLDLLRSLLEGTFVTVIEVSDQAGYSVNRMLFTQINEAAFQVFEGTASIPDIDIACQEFFRQILGPLALADLIGIDTVYEHLEQLYTASGSARFQPCPLLREFIKSGRLGRKSGRGFYKYG